MGDSNILDLESTDGMHCVGTANRVYRRLRQTEIFDLSLPLWVAIRN